MVRLTPDTLWYRSSGDVSPMSLGNADIQRSTSRSHRWAGLALGAVAGGAIGGLVAYNSFEPRVGYESLGTVIACVFNNCGPPPQVNSRSEETVGGAVGGALIGGTLGYFVGKMLGRWETVELDQITAGGGRLSLSLRIRL